MEITTVLLLLLGAMALLVPVGLILHGCGLSRSKNSAAAMGRGILALSVATLVFWAVGAAIMQAPQSSIFAFRDGLAFDAAQEADATTFLYLVFVLIGAASVPAVLGERSRGLVACALAALLAAVVIPICGYWCWNPHSWLNQIMGERFYDVGGASVVQMTAGLVAGIGAIFVGPRTGKYNRDGSANFIPGHSVPLAAAGMLLLSVGWIPYVLSAVFLHFGAAPQCAINILLAGSAGVIVSWLLSRVRYGKTDVLLVFAGLLGALVAITASGGMLNSICAVSVGAIAGILVSTLTVTAEMRFRIDDPSGTIIPQIIGGAWGTVAIGLFTPGSLALRMKHTSVQLIGVIALAAVALIVAATIMLSILKAFAPLRVSESDEFDGIDLAEHDLNAYPDFQQTTIKSYHLREV